MRDEQTVKGNLKMTPTSTFKMNKQTKRFMTRLVNVEQRNQFKRMMIDAQLCSEVKPKEKKGE